MSQQIALVTGGNRGIGLEVCRQLGQQGIKVILTSRDASKGAEAATNLQQSGLDVIFHPLDVSDAESVEIVRQYIEKNFGRLDILVNNAAIYPDEGVSIFKIGVASLRETLNTNTIGAFLTMQAFLPLMQHQQYGRVVNVTSEYGNIHQMESIVAAYCVSKVALNALTRLFASELKGYPDIKVNCADPGWVRTDMGGKSAPRSPEQGADTIVWLATLPAEGPTDGVFYERQKMEW
jgi:NAD(P)-dependent dehydrogenase (short-subunit alcohol dehydrogenase family)